MGVGDGKRESLEMKTVLITGARGLVGSEAIKFFNALGWKVFGIDNNSRKRFFGNDGDVGNLTSDYGDITIFSEMEALLQRRKYDAIIHCAAQPSHDYAADHAIEDFRVNALGTVHLLECARNFCPGAPFVFMSTNKVYGDTPNILSFIESDTRWDYENGHWMNLWGENRTIDHSTHSLFGCSKTAADLYVQEYGRYFGMNTVCFRAGCITGKQHAGAEQHGFLAYLARCFRENRPYTIYGYKGKQVRDIIHAYDVVTAMWEFIQDPKQGAVYNIGGGRENSISVLEAIAEFEKRFGKKLETEYVDTPRKGDHICYISDTRKLRSDYSSWGIGRPLNSILDELAEVK